MKKASAIAAALVVLAMTMVFMAEPGHAITCTDVDLALRSCVEYLKGSVPQPAVACCNGVKSIQAGAQTKADRQFACQCVKRAADALADLNEDAAKNLPTKCGVELNVPISRNVNCNNIN